MEYVIFLVLAASILALGFAYYFFKQMMSKSEGTDLMKKIAKHVRNGAMAYLKQQYKVVTLVFVVLAIIFAIMAYFNLQNNWVPFAFLTGGFFSGLAGFFGMKTATYASARTANAARKSLNSGLQIAFRSGAVMGLTVVGLGLLDVSLWYLILDHFIVEDGGHKLIVITTTMLTFGMGASTQALFARVGGGIYTKAADVGADLVGKVEAGIPEDDPRNPATIADNVGDNVGDVAGLGSDLLESYVGAIASAIILAIYTYFSLHGTADAISYNSLIALVSYPLMFCAIGLISCCISIVVFLLKKNYKNLSRSLNGTTYLAALLTIVLNLILTPFIFKESISSFRYGALSPWICAILGIVSGICIGLIAEYYTSYAKNPTLKLSDSSKEGAAIVITNGLGLGMNSTLYPVGFLALAIMISNACAGLYGVGMAAMGMLSFVAATVSVDTYGPIADNSGGIAEMCGLDPRVREITDELDALGNTTAAIGKGFAIGSAALAALSLFASYLYAVAGENSATLDLVLNMIDTLTLSGALIGAALPYLFSGVLISAVSHTAREMVDEVRHQFKANPGILEGTSIPQYTECISIASKGALSEMSKPAIISIVTPLISGFLFGPRFVGGLLIGTTLSAVMLAIFTANSGGAWDNAKKYIELGHHGGAGSPAHIASIVGDTVGDPLKDTVGPSLDILIKIMSVISVIMVSIYSEYNLISLL